MRDSLLGMFGLFLGEDRATSLEDEWHSAARNAQPAPQTLSWRTPAETLDELLRSAQQAGVATTP